MKKIFLKCSKFVGFKDLFWKSKFLENGCGRHQYQYPLYIHFQLISMRKPSWKFHSKILTSFKVAHFPKPLFFQKGPEPKKLLKQKINFFISINYAKEFLNSLHTGVVFSELFSRASNGRHYSRSWNFQLKISLCSVF